MVAMAQGEPQTGGSHLATFKASWELFKSGHLEDSKRIAKKSCDKGYMPNCFIVGKVENSIGNSEPAKKFFKYACDNRHFASCYELANIQANQNNVREAMKLYQILCESAGYGLGCYQVGKHKLAQRKRLAAQVAFEKGCLAMKSHEGSCFYSWYTAWLNGNTDGRIQLTNECVKAGHVAACILAARAHEIFRNASAVELFYKIIDTKCKDEPSAHCQTLAEFYLRKGRKVQAISMYEYLCNNRDKISCEYMNTLKAFQTGGSPRMPASASF